MEFHCNQKGGLVRKPKHYNQILSLYKLYKVRPNAVKSVFCGFLYEQCSYSTKETG